MACDSRDHELGVCPRLKAFFLRNLFTIPLYMTSIVGTSSYRTYRRTDQWSAKNWKNLEKLILNFRLGQFETQV